MNVVKGFRALRAMGKCTSRHLFSHGGLLPRIFTAHAVRIATSHHVVQQAHAKEDICP